MKKIHARQALTENGWQANVTIGIDDAGRIAEIGTGPAPAHPAHDLILPAPLNLHSHAFQRAMAGLTETRGADPRDSFWTWRRLMYRFLDRLTPDHVQAIASLVFMEMLEAGYGAVAEFHYLHHDMGGTPYANIAEMADRITAAANAAGIGLTLLPVLYTHGGCDGRPLAGGQRRFGTDPAAFARLHEAAARLIAAAGADYALGVAPHSLRAVTPEGLTAAVGLAQGGPVHMHLAEQVAEVEEVQAHLGARPAEWLLANQPVDDHWCLIHCTQMTAPETRALAATGAVAGLCPITESSLGDGIFDATGFVAAGGRFGIGSDSNIHISLFHELATLEYSQRLRDRSRAALANPAQSTGRVLFDNAAHAGAAAGGRASGRIAVGQWADLIGIATDNPWLCNRQGDTVLDSLVFTGRGQECITDVWSAGRHVVRDGRHFARDAITRDFMAVIRELGQDI
ncbi:formiminoglutamate deiminase [Lutimaribacter pacificus]|uniref:Formiminoglutamate deiminase n=1 Tax=Lutimaribacter pacificus TaxID=391948 RepID=A0A1H0IWV2_9RHOB|nr:formimidoylglutamate deiminase [Lutimaribacter pacificus]SDO35946.1 formiminoglutamate deiminase [Lutimaribacter pacificus]SHK16682.1 formiminoglutamate deiminase [Lutimaribacter pacificus]